MDDKRITLPDDNHFRHLSHEPPAVIPDDKFVEVPLRTTAEMIAERKAWLAGTEQCPTCGGHGRVQKKSES